MKRQRLISLLILFVIVIITSTIILYGKGYRLGFETGKVELNGTGLLVAKSTPDSAQVFINDHLTTATNNTLNLSPGTYSVKIFKDGYFPWEKKINVSAEVVSKAEALLVPSAPKLSNITDLGVLNPVMDPSQSKIAFVVASQSARKNGIYVLDMTSRPILTLQNSLSQVADDTIDSFSTSQISWSPDGKQLLATVSAGLASGSASTTYLLDAGSLNTNPQDVTETITGVEANWQKLEAANDRALINAQSKALRAIINKSFQIMAWSPDETKILYKASGSATLPILIKPRVLGVNSTPEERNLKDGATYVYDIKEDRNYPLDGSDFKNTYSWFPDSRHLLFIKDDKVHLVEYDGLNDTVVYAGPFVNGYAFPWPDASKIVILTNLGNSSISPNLYTISLK